ncbi:hypothetical protein N0V84_008170 [Fusarium piperis]|uniref:DhaK domain-containing protein n=1 Tax=Fusarium piperis TaxID=1435070 RepID=A0A9W9BL10_9HYPO|nr:hypothetical protein N0V84_008170 [Fusarium piperis]
MSFSTTKHVSQDPAYLVDSALRSLTLLNPSLRLDAQQKAVYYPLPTTPDEQHQQHVAVISGGGSGHEPSFGGLVGPGLLSAAVCGTIFASPSSHQILSAIHRVSTFSNEILVTVMNYTGDVLNFGMAVEKAKAAEHDLQVEMLVVADDVAVPRSKFGKVGRRGMAGTVLVQKATGALASLGYGLDDILAVGRLLCHNLATIGVALDKVHVPGRDSETFLSHGLAKDEAEIGLGIHNEPGCLRVQGADMELSALVRSSLDQLLNPNDPERAFVKNWSGCPILMVNNLGGLSVLELGAALTEVVTQLRETYGMRPNRIISGTFMTSLDCRGFSITLLNDISLAEFGVSHDIPSLLDHPAGAVGWSHNINSSHRTLDQGQMDGTSGAVYSIYMDALQQYFRARAPDAIAVDSFFWSKALTNALSVLAKYTPARRGDRTLMDTIIPFVETLDKTQNIGEAIKDAELGALSTKHMRAGLGRSVSLGFVRFPGRA